MAEKENEKEVVKESKPRRKKAEEETTAAVEEKQKAGTVKKDLEEHVLKVKPEEEAIAENVDNEEQISSLDMLWRHAFSEIDEWAKRSDYRDEVFLNASKNFAESVQRNQGNLKAIAAQFNKELAEWERTAREELLMSTTTLQHFFPIRSYEEINSQIDQIQQRTMTLLSKPCQAISNYQVMNKYLEVINQYIELRKKGRMQYINAVKQAGNLIYENQRGFVNLFARQIKTLMFPLNKYMEKTEEHAKS